MTTDKIFSLLSEKIVEHGDESKEYRLNIFPSDGVVVAQYSNGNDFLFRHDGEDLYDALRSLLDELEDFDISKANNILYHDYES